MPVFRTIRSIYERLLRLSRLAFLRPDLTTLLTSIDPRADLGERIDWLESLLRWVRIPLSPGANVADLQKIEEVRVRFLLQWLDRNPEYRRRASEVLASVLLETDPVPLFCQTGLARESGFLSELVERLLRKALPKAGDDRDFSELFARVFSAIDDAAWIDGLNADLVDKIVGLICFSDDMADRLSMHYRLSMADALLVIGAEVASHGLFPDIRNRADNRVVLQSPFFLLNKKIMQVHEVLFDGVSGPELPMLFAEAEELCTRCRREIQSVFSHLDEHGVSVAIVYRLELIDQLVARCEMILTLLLNENRLDLRHTWQTLFAELIRGKIENTHLRPLFRDNLHLVSRKIAERTGLSGEHYITRTPREYFGMLASAGGGGVLTVFTAYIKFFIVKLHAAAFFDFLFHALNYSSSFIVMHFMHFTLATKQPSMTAPALAARLKNITERHQLEALVTDIARLTRSNFAAALGNVGMVIPGVIVFDFLFFYAFRQHVIDPTYALKTIHSLHPLKSLTIPFAALTGVILWSSSIAAGWIENWIVFRRLPESISQSRPLQKAFGKAGAQKVSDWFIHNVSGVTGNVCIGTLLALPPLLGRFFGVSLDVRHITLSTGSLVFAICSLWRTDLLHMQQIGWAVAGLVCIGALNFGVSFYLALNVAINARQVRKAWLRYLRVRLARRFFTRPFEFFFPVREAKT